MTDEPTFAVVECPACGTPGAGRFCSACAAPLTAAVCTRCAALQLAGARFCHECGAAARGPAASAAARSRVGPVSAQRRQPLIIAVAAGAFVAATLFVVAQRSVGIAGATSAIAPIEQRDNGDIAAHAPDISAMSPRERAERLYDRAMMAQQQGKTDSATFFATMASIAYGQIGETTLDDHYDLGRLALLGGKVALAGAEADTILAARPTHLLGLLLSEDVARARGESEKARSAHALLLASATAEQRLELPEYRQHATELATVLGGVTTSPGRSTP
jgi:hypothetical protein